MSKPPPVKCIYTYKDTSSASRGWTFATKTFDLAIRLHLVIFQDGHLDLLALMLDLLRSLRTYHRFNRNTERGER
jgi:hypothetical protein